jgi:ATP-binding cassette subfamily B protein
VVGYTPQDSFLFSDTIKSNIAFGAGNPNESEIIEAATKAHVHDDIEGFPEGYNTIIGERGITLSGGQKQRITIARALIQKPNLLILDDALSAVDTETEDHILKNLSVEMKSISSVIISHRVSSVKLADKILVLDDGELSEQGTHNELIKHNGLYAEIYHEQQVSEEAS